MALTPHAEDPKRKEQLREINKMVKSGEVGKGMAKQNWNTDDGVEEKDSVRKSGPESSQEAEAEAEAEVAASGKKGK